jgi:hypothetical protein
MFRVVRAAIVKLVFGRHRGRLTVVFLASYLGHYDSVCFTIKSGAGLAALVVDLIPAFAAAAFAAVCSRREGSEH